MITTFTRKIGLTVKRPFVFLISRFALTFGDISTNNLAANVIGPFSVVFISLLVMNIVASLYFCLAPWKLSDWPVWRFAIHWLTAHVAAFNIAYHYYMCAFTDPGMPIYDVADSFTEDGWCRKCAAVKPPLTHHCSVCKRCVLRMDHHCTWTNNCVGWKNHRHFFLFCLFTFVSCFYAFNSGGILYYHHTLYGFGIAKVDELVTENGITAASLGLFEFDCDKNVLVLVDDDNLRIETKDAGHVIVHQTLHSFRNGFRLHRLAVVELYLCLLFCILLGFLTAWHFWLISTAHTSLDDIGGYSKALWRMSFYEFLENWRLFFGLDQPNASLLNRFLLPSHQPPAPLRAWITKAQKLGIIKKKGTLTVV